MEAMILAGGFGTRLKTVIADLPKPMAPVGGKPFLEHLLLFLSQQAISKFVLCTGYKHEIIEKYFGSSFQGIPVEYSIETEPLGTGGAVQNALMHITGESFLLLNGDTFFGIDVAELIAEHARTRAAISIALKEMTDFDRYGTVCLEKGRIIKFEEKKKLARGLINGGVYSIKKNIFDLLLLPQKFSFEKDLLEKCVDDLILNGIVFQDYFIDIGIPEDYARAQTELIQHSV
jgi:D-glycero-alpha-D-manno-heptose 1-phosphate guanylyltransferase